MRQIPSTAGTPTETRRVLDAVKENIEELRGVNSTPIVVLPSTATLSDCINKINEIIARLQT